MPELMLLSPDQILFNADTLTLRQPLKDSNFIKWLIEDLKKIRKNDSGEVVCDHGLINPIAVRPVPGIPGQYALVDGGQRLCAWKGAFGSSKQIPAHVMNLSDAQVIEAQIEGNFHNLKTTKPQFAKGVMRVLRMNTDRTIRQEAERLGMEEQTLKNILSLVSLEEPIQEAIDNGVIPAVVGYELAKMSDNKPEHDSIWTEMRQVWFERAKVQCQESQGAEMFCVEAAEAVKAQKALFREGKIALVDRKFEPVPTLRKLSEIKGEYTHSKENLDTLTTDISSVPEMAARKLYQMGYVAGISFTLKMDEDTIAARSAKFDQEKAEKLKASEEKKGIKKAEVLARASGEGKI